MSENYPRGNAKVDDLAWYRSTNRLSWQHGKVIEVGLTNEFGRALNIRLKIDGDGEIELPPYPPWKLRGDKPEAQVLIFAPHTPEAIAKVLAKYRNLIATRAGGNHMDERFKLLCIACEQWVDVGRTTTESSDLYYHSNGAVFRANKPEVLESGTELTCGCGMTYNFPFVDYDGDGINKE